MYNLSIFDTIIRYYDCKLVDVSNVPIKHLLWQSITADICVWYGSKFKSNLFNIKTNSMTNSRV